MSNPSSIPGQSIAKGAALALSCLLLLSIMPVISNARPGSGAGTDALAFAFWLSIWQLLVSPPVLGWETAQKRQGAFAPDMPSRLRLRLISIIFGTGLLFGLSTFFYVLAAEKAGAVSAALALQAYPLFAIVLESFFLGRRKTKIELMFTGLLLLALTYLATDGQMRPDSLSPWFLFALLIPLIWSIAHVSLREVMMKSRTTPAQITFFRVLVSSLFLFALLVQQGGLASLGDALMHGELQFWAALMGAVYYLELLLWFYAIRHIDVSLASSLTVPAPAGTMIFAVLVLSDVIEGYQIVAMILVMASLYGLILAGKRKQPAARPIKSPSGNFSPE